MDQVLFAKVANQLEFERKDPLISTKLFNTLFTGNPYTGIFTNSENPNEMPHNAAFHQGQHYLLR